MSEGATVGSDLTTHAGSTFEREPSFRPHPGDVLLRADNLSKTWSPTAGLAAISFALSSGERVVLRGRSGSGKSTLLGLLAGWCEPDGGSLVRVGPWADDERWREWTGTAVVPQTLGLLSELPIGENVSLGLRLTGVDRRSIAERTYDILELVDLLAERHRLPAEISLGQRQRAAVARAVVSRPKLVLADEPTCHQDVLHAQMVLDALNRIAADGGAVLIASHDDAVISHAERIISLD